MKFILFKHCGDGHFLFPLGCPYVFVPAIKFPFAILIVLLCSNANAAAHFKLKQPDSTYAPINSGI